MTPEFKPFPKMARLSRECIITEKIDGTNASVYIGPTDFKTPNESVSTIFKKDGTVLGMWAGSRTRWLTTASDNFGFANWVVDNATELFGLGEGHHFGEWWGSGIQRGYGFKNGERFFSLFNALRWVEKLFLVFDYFALLQVTQPSFIVDLGQSEVCGANQPKFPACADCRCGQSRQSHHAGAACQSHRQGRTSVLP